MKNKTWKLGPDEIRLVGTFPRRAAFVVNGAEVARAKVGDLRGTDITLSDGRRLEVRLDHEYGEGYDVRLTHEGRHVPDESERPNHLCAECVEAVDPLDAACPKCGAEVDSTRHFAVRRVLRQATGALKLLTFLFAMFALFTYVTQHREIYDALDHLAQFEDSETLAPIDGVTYTAGELRREVRTQFWTAVGVNALLAIVFAGLTVQARRTPLAALSAATALYLMVQVGNALADSASICSGAVVKFIVLATLMRGLKAARALPKVVPSVAPRAF